MASFQIPQFLDSGDKIIANLNFRQFGWALGGGLLSFFAFSILTPIFGMISLVVVAPLAGTFAFIAFGSYNGRDAELYLKKFIEYFQKPKQLKYQRQPFIQDLQKKQAEWSYNAIITRWQSEVEKEKALSQNEFLAFKNQSVDEKAVAISKLSEIMNQSKVNVMANILKEEEDIQRLKQQGNQL